MLAPETVDDLRLAIRSHGRLRLRGGGTKPALSASTEGVETLDLSRLSGVVDYDPGEYTFTARAGTPVTEVLTLLDSHGQYMPFDPPRAERGATLGGTVASGLSGPGRYRYGGIRDFILGVGFVDSAGRWVHAGGKVVKNAAGFDIPKLMVGSLGEFGALVEVTLKVFPRAEGHVTVELRGGMDAVMDALYRLYTARVDLASLDLAPSSDGATATLWARISGASRTLPDRAERVRHELGGGEILEDTEEASLWRDARELGWAPTGWNLIKVPLTPKSVQRLEDAVAGRETVRRYSSGANIAWVATPESPETWDERLRSLGLAGLVVDGPSDPVRIGMRRAEALEARVKAVFDSDGRFSRM